MKKEKKEMEPDVRVFGVRGQCVGRKYRLLILAGAGGTA